LWLAEDKATAKKRSSQLQKKINLNFKNYFFPMIANIIIKIINNPKIPPKNQPKVLVKAPIIEVITPVAIRKIIKITATVIGIMFFIIVCPPFSILYFTGGLEL
jgi:hypothetical protein